MQTVYIKFLTEEDRVNGYYELAMHSGIGSFPGKIYQVSKDALILLEDLHIGYRRASDDEIREAHDQVRNPSAAVL